MYVTFLQLGEVVVEREEDSPYKRKCRSWGFDCLVEDSSSCSVKCKVDVDDVNEGGRTLELFPLHPEGRWWPDRFSDFDNIMYASFSWFSSFPICFGKEERQVIVSLIVYWSLDLYYFMPFGTKRLCRSIVTTSALYSKPYLYRSISSGDGGCMSLFWLQLLKTLNRSFFRLKAGSYMCVWTLKSTHPHLLSFFHKPTRLSLFPFIWCSHFKLQKRNVL